MMLALNGHPVRFYGEVGQDQAGILVREGLRTYGMNVDGVHVSDRGSTGITVSLTYPRDRMYITYPGTTSTTELEQGWHEVLQGGGHLHLASFFLLKGLRKRAGALLRKAKAAGMSVSFDPGGDPSDTWDISDLEDSLQFIDVLMPNADEIRGLTGLQDLENALSAFPESVQCIVVKAGSEGAFIRYRGEIERHRGFKVDVQDTSCAGDCFDAGFLHGWLRGEDLRRCIRWANLFGAQAVSVLGLPDQKIDVFIREQENERHEGCSHH
jgi:sugar/nucleoside kinase (ribokinase family)